MRRLEDLKEIAEETFRDINASQALKRRILEKAERKTRRIKKLMRAGLPVAVSLIILAVSVNYFLTPEFKGMPNNGDINPQSGIFAVSTSPGAQPHAAESEMPSLMPSEITAETAALTGTPAPVRETAQPTQAHSATHRRTAVQPEKTAPKPETLLEVQTRIDYIEWNGERLTGEAAVAFLEWILENAQQQQDAQPAGTVGDSLNIATLDGETLTIDAFDETLHIDGIWNVPGIRDKYDEQKTEKDDYNGGYKDDTELIDDESGEQSSVPDSQPYQDDGDDENYSDEISGTDDNLAGTTPNADDGYIQDGLSSASPEPVESYEPSAEKHTEQAHASPSPTPDTHAAVQTPAMPQDTHLYD